MFSTMFKEKEITQEMKNTISEIENQVINKTIPDFYPDYMINKLDSYERRSKFIDQMGFVLISHDWIKPLAKWIGDRKCLEVMSGSGALSYALKNQGTNIIATDNYSWWKDRDDVSAWWDTERMWTQVENIDAIEAIEKYCKDIDIIIMSWAYMDDTAYRVLLKMREINPNCIMIFIGENYGGCTASDEFFDNIQKIEDKDFDEAVNNFKQWWGIHDYPQLVK